MEYLYSNSYHAVGYLQERTFYLVINIIKKIQISGMNTVIALTLLMTVFVSPLLSYLSGQEAELVLSGFVFPEGPSFDAEGNLYVVDCQTHAITRITPDGKSSVLVQTPGKTNGSIIDRSGNLYLAGWDIPMIVKVFPNGTFTVYKESFKGESLQGPNDFAIDARDRLYFTDPLYDKKALDKCSRALYVDTDGAVKWLVDIPGYTNGMAFAKDPAVLYIAETLSRQIWKVTLNADGSARDQTVLITLPEPDYPDGMAVDVNGDLYVAAYNSGCIRHISPAGELIDSIKVPGKSPTNCAFGGPDNDILYVTEVETGSVYKIQMNVKGLPLLR